MDRKITLREPKVRRSHDGDSEYEDVLYQLNNSGRDSSYVIENPLALK